mmetsp:Transcript_38683/g.114946  ORF Transcript_38683/g.114946 Transcript_38683/m.114946 type:complete len:470 (+) Transcript_38683:706-2115(+)
MAMSSLRAAGSLGASLPSTLTTSRSTDTRCHGSPRSRWSTCSTSPLVAHRLVMSAPMAASAVPLPLLLTDSTSAPHACALSSSRTSALSTLSLTSAATASGCGCACPGGCVARPSPAPSPQSLPEGSSSRPSSTDAGTAGSDAMRETRPFTSARLSTPAASTDTSSSASARCCAAVHFHCVLLAGSASHTHVLNADGVKPGPRSAPGVSPEPNSPRRTGLAPGSPLALCACVVCAVGGASTGVKRSCREASIHARTSFTTTNEGSAASSRGSTWGTEARWWRKSSVMACAATAGIDVLRSMKGSRRSARSLGTSLSRHDATLVNMSTCCFVAGSTWWVTSRKRSGRWRSIRRHSDTKSPRCRTKLTGDTSMIDPCDVAASMSATSDSCAVSAWRSALFDFTSSTSTARYRLSASHAHSHCAATSAIKPPAPSCRRLKARCMSRRPPASASSSSSTAAHGMRLREVLLRG